jgi:hypothetical protein
MELAEKLGISYAMLFMPTVPAPDDPPIPDLRTFESAHLPFPLARRLMRGFDAIVGVPLHTGVDYPYVIPICQSLIFGNIEKELYET